MAHQAEKYKELEEVDLESGTVVHNPPKTNSEANGTAASTATKDDGSKDKVKKPFNWRRLLKLAYPERFLLMAGTVGLVVSSAVTLLGIGLVGAMVDSFTLGSPEEGIRVLQQTVLALFGVFVVGSIFTVIRASLFTIAGERVVKRLRGELFASLVEQEIGFFDEHRTGEIVSRLADDCGVLQNTVTTNISMALRQLVQLFGSICVILVLSWRLTLVMLAVVPLLVVGAVTYGKFVKGISKKVQDAVAEANSTAEEALSNIRTVRSFCGEEREKAAYVGGLEKGYQLAKKRGVAYGAFSGGMFFAGNLALIAVLYYGGMLVLSGEMTVGELMSFVLYTVWIAACLGIFTSLYNDFMKGIGASQRVFELLDRTPAIRLVGEGTHVDKLQGDLVFENVDFSYPSRSETIVLSQLSFTVKGGQTVALVGPSGGGKSTVVSLIKRFYDPTGGRVLVDGRDLCSLDRFSYMRHVGSVMQEPVLFATSIRENITYGLTQGEDVSDDLVEKCARDANAWEFISKMPDKLSTTVGERGVRLSGGQKQRIAIARALIKQPSLLLLDEATSALDSESEALVQVAIDKLISAHNRTTIVIAHRLSTIRNSDSIIVVSGGVVAQRGTHDELTSEEGVYKQLITKQMFGYMPAAAAVGGPQTEEPEP